MMHFRQTSSYITYNIYWSHIFSFQLKFFSSRERNGIFFVTKTLFLLSKHQNALRLRRQTRTTTRTNRVALLYETTEREKKRCPKKRKDKTLFFQYRSGSARCCVTCSRWCEKSRSSSSNVGTMSSSEAA